MLSLYSLLHVAMLCVSSFCQPDLSCIPNAGKYGDRSRTQVTTTPRDENDEDGVHPLFKRSEQNSSFSVGGHFGMIRTSHQYSDNTDGVNERSLCQWNYQLDKNETRQPKHLYKAVCRSTSCNFNINGLSDVTRNILAYETECVPVYHKIRIILGCCVNGRYVQKWIFEDWPVACACSIKRTHVVENAGQD
ncbi:hypothetical protein CHS0354_006979 [Potamilus streckersoni]|uniref:Uncharacterized protein n=1 Tax=Potamilus streckersoni TaxID=2493646 RepID=A0AAE0RWQ2_9BIVA|nr:hypothetical protein CHS0354_006979 [Potamilus streckersoni]